MSANNQRLALDLERNEDLASLVADMEPGDKLDAVLSIVARDDKTLTVELDEVTEGVAAEEEEQEEEGEGDTPAVKMMRGESSEE